MNVTSTLCDFVIRYSPHRIERADWPSLDDAAAPAIVQIGEALPTDCEPLQIEAVEIEIED